MTSRTWHKGPPPHIGWWNASIAGDLTSWRWWNGKHWSYLAYEGDSEINVEKSAMTPADLWQEDIEWTYYYPKKARVPRINPMEKKNDR